MEDFSLDLSNILNDEQLNALNNEGEKKEKQDTPPEIKENTSTENLTASELFDSESVSKSDEDNKKIIKDDNDISVLNTDAPPKNIYSSIAKAFKTDDIFDLSDEEIDNIKTSDDFANAIEKQIQSKFDERQKRIDDALNNGVPADSIKMFENNIGILNSITDENIEDESEQGIELRRNLIIRDYLNRGYTEEKAAAMAQRSFDSNNDIDDAKDALQQNKDFFKREYNKLLTEAKKKADKEKKDIADAAERLRKSIFEEKKAFGELDVDKGTRQKIYDTISKPYYKDPATGQYLTELQKYEKDNHNDFMKNIGYLYVITDGFKTLGNITKTIERKVNNKGIKNLENIINTTYRNSDGSLRLINDSTSDKESYFSGGWTLDLNN